MMTIKKLGGNSKIRKRKSQIPAGIAAKSSRHAIKGSLNMNFLVRQHDTINNEICASNSVFRMEKRLPETLSLKRLSVAAEYMKSDTLLSSTENWTLLGCCYAPETISNSSYHSKRKNIHYTSHKQEYYTYWRTRNKKKKTEKALTNNISKTII